MTVVPTSMPEAELALLKEAYGNANVILEYGSGESTRIASRMPGKYVLSVESDRKWARHLRHELTVSAPHALVTVFHVDIGETGPWGRAIDESRWRNYHLYPNSIWDEAFFRHPDVILIDGRFRTACLMTALLRIDRPVQVLFDDYVNRPRYQLVEQIIRPKRLIGRMAEFRLTPGMVTAKDTGLVIRQFFEGTIHAPHMSTAYDLSASEEKMLKAARDMAEKERSYDHQ